jgi:hypothetical protein
VLARLDNRTNHIRGRVGPTRRGTHKVAAIKKSLIDSPQEARSIGFDIGLQLFLQGCSAHARAYYRAMFLDGYDLQGEQRKAWISGFDAGYQGRRLGAEPIQH